MWNIAIAAAAALFTLWWEFIKKKDSKRDYALVIIGSIFTVLTFTTAYQEKCNNERNDLAKEELAQEKRKSDSLRSKITFDSLRTAIAVARKAEYYAEQSHNNLLLMSQNNARDALNNYNNILYVTFNEIKRRSESFQLHESPDSMATVLIYKTIPEISDLVASVKQNPILLSNPFVYRFHHELDSALETYRSAINYYYNADDSFEKVWFRYRRSLRKFTHFVILYPHKTFIYQKFSFRDSMKIKEVEDYNPND